MRAEGFFCNLDVLSGGPGLGKSFLIPKIFVVHFFKFLVIKTLDPEWIGIRIGIQPIMLDTDPYQMNTETEALALTDCFDIEA